MKKIIDDFKMKVTPYESRKVQKILIKNGYNWESQTFTTGDYNDVHFTDSPILYLWYGRIYRSSSPNFTDKDNERELTCDEFCNLYDIKTQRKSKLQKLKNDED